MASTRNSRLGTGRKAAPTMVALPQVLLAVSRRLTMRRRAGPLQAKRRLSFQGPWHPSSRHDLSRRVSPEPARRKRRRQPFPMQGRRSSTAAGARTARRHPLPPQAVRVLPRGHPPGLVWTKCAFFAGQRRVRPPRSHHPLWRSPAKARLMLADLPACSSGHVNRGIGERPAHIWHLASVRDGKEPRFRAGLVRIVRTRPGRAADERCRGRPTATQS